MDEDSFRPSNYRRTNAKFKYRARDELKSREYYHMPPINNGPPVRLNNNKKYQQEEERMTEIERSNRILFEKMRNIKMKKGPYCQIGEETGRRRLSLRALINKTPVSVRNDFSTLNLNPQVARERPTHREYNSIARETRSMGKKNNSMSLAKANKETKLLYKQEKQIDGKYYMITAYIQDGQFWLKADEDGGQVSNYMRMQMVDYINLKKLYLPKGIESLLGMIKIDKVIELKGLESDLLREIQEGEPTLRFD